MGYAIEHARGSADRLGRGSGQRRNGVPHGTPTSGGCGHPQSRHPQPRRPLRRVEVRPAAASPVTRGRKTLDDRRVVNGIVREFRIGTAWRDVPERYGPWATLLTRFRRWTRDGTFARCSAAPRQERTRRVTSTGRVGRLHDRPGPSARRTSLRRALRNQALRATGSDAAAVAAGDRPSTARAARSSPGGDFASVACTT
ncbi:transposase [Streptomyces sp. NPDC055952]|uniref:transposase n=1 Tax=Streptomyces sp. NPDC055952 TaxID=3345663 RepID=UPI0035DAAC24